MRGEAMSVTAAVRGSIVLLLSMSVVKGQNGWSVSYSSHQICAPRGSTINMSCNFTYPNTTGLEVEKTFWFARTEGQEYIDVKSDPQYSGRVKNTCTENRCTLTITDLRQSDSATYKFRIITNKSKYFGKAGVRVYFTDLQVLVSQDPSLSLQCVSRCPLDTSFIWFKNGQKINQKTPKYDPGHGLSKNRYSCAAEGYEEFHPPSVYAPERPIVSVSPTAEIVEGTAVHLSCSSDANPAANYTWYREEEDSPIYSGQILIITNFSAEDSGNYSCEAKNTLGWHKSRPHPVIVTVADDGGITIPIIAGAVHAVLLAVVFLCVVLWVRRKRTPNESSLAERPNNSRQGKVDEQEEPQYGNIHFSEDQENLYGNIGPAQPAGHTKQEEVPVYENILLTSAARRTNQEEDPSALHSKVT